MHSKANYVQDSVLGIGGKAVKRTEKNPCIHEAYIPVGEMASK